jgi:hypothetical protein
MMRPRVQRRLEIEQLGSVTVVHLLAARPGTAYTAPMRTTPRQPTLAIGDIRVGRRHRRDLGDIAAFGGTTAYDTEAGLVSWQAIAAYGAGTDPYATRVSNLLSGTGVPLLDATVVTGNGGGNTLTGSGELALLYTDGADTLSGFDPSSQSVTITP